VNVKKREKNNFDKGEKENEGPWGER